MAASAFAFCRFSQAAIFASSLCNLQIFTLMADQEETDVNILLYLITLKESWLVLRYPKKKKKQKPQSCLQPQVALSW